MNLYELQPQVSLFSGTPAPCVGPLENIAVYEGDLNTLMYFPASPNGVKWINQATSDELTEAQIVNYDDTVNPTYAADYAYSPSAGLTIRNATTTLENGHPMTTAGYYTAQCVGGNKTNVKVLVVRKLSDCIWKMFQSSMTSFRYSSRKSI